MVRRDEMDCFMKVNLKKNNFENGIQGAKGLGVEQRDKTEIRNHLLTRIW